MNLRRFSCLNAEGYFKSSAFDVHKPDYSRYRKKMVETKTDFGYTN